MVYAPLVMPEVILGLSLLLLFVSLRLPRGFWTVTASHATVTLCYATVVIQARLGSFDRSLEEAAQDLGLTPARAFLAVTLPNIAPAVAAAWMLALTLVVFAEKVFPWAQFTSYTIGVALVVLGLAVSVSTV
jgi:putrescine transport system permease protein